MLRLGGGQDQALRNRPDAHGWAEVSQSALPIVLLDIDGKYPGTWIAIKELAREEGASCPQSTYEMIKLGVHSVFRHYRQNAAQVA